ncbi:MAG: hypothetical protein OQK55_11365 [Thermoanaerobaculales bacterium]|nr:hypothetical protein [Thermoanaerobaculales bacterium]
MLDTRYSILDARCSMLDARFNESMKHLADLSRGGRTGRESSIQYRGSEGWWRAHC